MDDKTLFRLMVDLHKDGLRQGPGSIKTTRRALDLTGLGKSELLRVADIGCGTGASTLVLARELPHSHITAVDLFPAFLDLLVERVQAAGLLDRVQPLEASMECLEFAPGSLDLLWSEGAIYNMGFVEGLRAWRPFLRAGGVIAVSEITWLQPDPPERIREYWLAAYPQIGTVLEKVTALEGEGYEVLSHFMLPRSDWTRNYYEPTAERMPAFLKRHQGSAEAAEIIAMEKEEFELYKQFRDWFGYGFYVARKRP
ncbi:MAG: methyltransferase domain-containing protein [Rhodothermales bacterium]|nr:methyltransferase domain-containing protein [Rhodothermales bacterium]